MQPVSETLKPDFLTDTFIEKVVDVLGAERCAFVGGAVRDSLLGYPVSDIDMATSHQPETVMELLQSTDIRVVPTGLKHGTVTAVGDRHSVEITTLRADVETDGRHAKVAFVEDWSEDAKRRDFTLNAIYLKPDGEVYDPVDGLADLKTRRVRFIGDPDVRIQEDALRILRFYRFSARFAEEIDLEGHEACVRNRTLLDGLSGERVRDEVFKIIQTPKVADILPVMETDGLLAQIFPEGLDTHHLLRLLRTRPNQMADVGPVSMLWLMLKDAFTAEMISQRLKLSGAQRKHWVTLDESAPSIERFTSGTPEEGRRGVREVCYRAGQAYARDLVIFYADNNSLDTYLDHVDNWNNPSFPVQGRDLMKFGLPSGPDLGQRLAELEQVWVASDFTLTKQELLNRL